MCLGCTNPRRSVRSVLICFLSKAEAQAKLLLTPPVAMSNLIICPSSNHLPTPNPPLPFSSTVGLSACTHDSPDPRALGVFAQSPPSPSLRVLSSCSASCRKSRRDKGVGGGGGGGGRGGERCEFKTSKGRGGVYYMEP
ncbi:hypothetical protein C4D60_Mb10t19020 [Musa balbisiana]|uniref:Uncharacterized protein n=1 Tax=Musa balbisiana TaxID=52838 RepID=A0A4S8IY56_MUSBA|nr:hypothetical protein C4D60_Mb10t19020 [Musa balbisiana]